EQPAVQQVEVSFVGRPPTHQVARASGVSAVEADGSVLRCLVCGSFQPFLEALRGHEVTGLQATPIPSVKETTVNSPKPLARIAGLLYLLVAVFDIFAALYVRARLVRSGDAPATADHLRTPAGLFPIGFRPHGR